MAVEAGQHCGADERKGRARTGLAPLTEND